MSALHGLFPVPKPVLYSTDESIVGTEFYVMEYLEVCSKEIKYASVCYVEM